MIMKAPVRIGYGQSNERLVRGSDLAAEVKNSHFSNFLNGLAVNKWRQIMPRHPTSVRSPPEWGMVRVKEFRHTLVKIHLLFCPTDTALKARTSTAP
jgi:hypothetical protein